MKGKFLVSFIPPGRSERPEVDEYELAEWPRALAMFLLYLSRAEGCPVMISWQPDA